VPLAARARYAIVLAVVAGVGLGVVTWRARLPKPETPAPVAPLAIVPPGPAFVLSVDLRRLRASHAGQALVGRGLAELRGDPCESRIAGEVDEVVVALPAEREPGRSGAAGLALIAAGHFRGDAVATCAEQRIVARHGDAVRTTIGSFSSVRDRHQTAEVSARNGLLIVSDGAYLRELLDGAEGHRAEGTLAERARDRLHAELRRVFGRGAPVMATLALPNGWLADALSEPGAERSPLSAIRSAALRAELGRDLDVSGLVACEASGPCEHLERFFANARTDLRPLLPADAAELLDRVTLTRTEARIELSAHVGAEDLSKLSPAPSASAATSAR